MRSALAEVIVGLPHLVAVDRLPASVTADGVTVELTDERFGADVVGTLRAHVRGARWVRGRHDGAARYEVVRTHADRCAVTLVIDGVDVAAAYHLVLAARRLMLDSSGRAAPTATTHAGFTTRPAAQPA